MPKNTTLIGILLMVLSSAALSSKDGLAKTFIDQLDPFQIIWVQFTGTFLIVGLASMPRYGLKVLRPRPLGGQFLRGAMNVSAIACLYWSLKYIPLADATAMLLFAPAMATIVSPFVLGEKIGPLRIGAVAVGFLGVLVILRPGFAGDPFGYYIGMVSGLCLGGYFVANRRLAGSQPVILDVVHNAFTGAMVLTPLALAFWIPVPDSLHMELVFIVILGIAGQGMMIASFKFGPAAVISPYSYSLLIFAALIGYLVFGDVPDALSWTGMGLIVGSGVFIAYRERRLAGS